MWAHDGTRTCSYRASCQHATMLRSSYPNVARRSSFATPLGAACAGSACAGAAAPGKQRGNGSAGTLCSCAPPSAAVLLLARTTGKPSGMVPHRRSFPARAGIQQQSTATYHTRAEECWSALHPGLYHRCLQLCLGSDRVHVPWWHAQ